MTDLVGADLQVESGQGTTEATPVSTPMYPAEPGYARDALGNQYPVSRQETGQRDPAGGTTGNQAASSVDGSFREPQGVTPPPTPPQMDPTIVQAVRDAQLRAAQSEARVTAMEQAQWEAQVRQLPADQQRIAIAERRAQLTAAQYQQAAQRQAQQQQSLEPLAKRLVVMELAQQYAKAGITKESLERFTSPEAMAEFCRYWAENRRADTNVQRQAAGVDRAATAGTSSRPTQSNWRSQSRLEQLSAAFAE